MHKLYPMCMNKRYPISLIYDMALRLSSQCELVLRIYTNMTKQEQSVYNVGTRLSLSTGRMVRTLGRATYIPVELETCHGLMPRKCLSLWPLEKIIHDITMLYMLSVNFEYE